MRVLMLGWEFPPHISGGLGTACLGITQGLTEKGVDLTFILPSMKSEDSGNSETKLRSASGVPISHALKRAVEQVRNHQHHDEFSELLLRPVNARLHPYGYDYSKDMDASAFNEGDIAEISHFHGGYKDDLMDEVYRFSTAAAAVVLEENAKKKADVIHAHDWMTYPAATIASRLSGLPFVAHLHATEFDRCGDHGWDVIYGIERDGLNAADHVICVSERTKRIAVERYGVPEHKVSVVYNGAFLNEDIPTFEIPEAVKHEKRVLFMARITFQKGPEYFVEAARLVLNEMPNTRFIMAGSGDLLPRMMKRVAELRMGSQFHFPGFMRGKEEVYRMYSMADLFVMPSVSEPFGIAPLEALQCGAPILISKQSGCAEVLPAALTVDYWDVRRMADRIMDCLNYPVMAQESLRQCQADLQLLTWGRAAEGILQAYSHVCPNA